MKALLSILSLFAVSAAHAHESLAPHAHPHGVSMLPDLHTLIAVAVAVAVVALVYVKLGRNR
jgi:hypothetical protein